MGAKSFPGGKTISWGAKSSKSFPGGKTISWGAKSPKSFPGGKTISRGVIGYIVFFSLFTIIW